MDDKDQKAGEARVRQVLVDQLERMGLMRPGGMTREMFEAMQRELCQRLAYMSEPGLAALAEEMAGRGGGKDRDRFPLAGKILEAARHIEPPREDASPLIRKVFAATVGETALRDGWAVELLEWVRDNRRWPGTYISGQLRDGARANLRRAFELDAREVGGAVLSVEDERWIMARRAAHDRAQRARDLGLADAARREVEA